MDSFVSANHYSNQYCLTQRWEQCYIKGLMMFLCVFINYDDLFSSVGRYELKRPWVECLSTNKLNWKEKAMKGKVAFQYQGLFTDTRITR
jgi:hypothetical protein